MEHEKIRAVQIYGGKGDTPWGVFFRHCEGFHSSDDAVQSILNLLGSYPSRLPICCRKSFGGVFCSTCGTKLPNMDPEVICRSIYRAQVELLHLDSSFVSYLSESGWTMGLPNEGRVAVVRDVGRYLSGSWSNLPVWTKFPVQD